VNVNLQAFCIVEDAKLAGNWSPERPGKAIRPIIIFDMIRNSLALAGWRRLWARREHLGAGQWQRGLGLARLVVT